MMHLVTQILLGIDTVGQALQLRELHGIGNVTVAQLFKTHLTAWQEVTLRRIEQTPNFALFFELFHRTLEQFDF